MSPYLIECCLRASANVSYENAAQDIESYTGIKVSGKTQQRLVHRYQFEDFKCESKVAEISLDGEKVRQKKAAYNFCIYLQNHRHGIVNYEYFHTQDICAIASGAVESTVKQIDRRLKISERTCPYLAQWKVENIPQVLRYRCVTRS